jgi:glycosyltransferase involved in cell wall biosynthesis
MNGEKPKKILIIITKGEVGGAQMSVFNLAKELKNKGKDVVVGMGEGEFLKDKLEKEGIATVKFTYLKRTHNPVVNWLFVREVVNFLNSNEFDLVHINSSNALFAAKGAKKSKDKPKTVFTFRGMSMLDPGYKDSGFKKFLYKLLFKYLLHHVDEPVFVSQHNLDLAKKEKIVKYGHLVYNGLDPDNLEFLPREQARKELLSTVGTRRGAFPGAFPQENGVNDDVFLLGSIGRLHYQKNYEFLINIFPEILEIKPDARAVIIGDGPARAEYEKAIKDKGLEDRIILAGSIPDASVYLKAFDIFLLPSRYEGLSITLIEALFAGVPVLTSRVGGAEEMFPPAQLYEFDNNKEFLRKFFDLATDAKTREIAGDINRQNANRFVLEKTVKGYLKLYQ